MPSLVDTLVFVPATLAMFVMLTLAFALAISFEMREVLLSLYERICFYHNDPRRPRRRPREQKWPNRHSPPARRPDRKH